MPGGGMPGGGPPRPKPGGGIMPGGIPGGMPLPIPGGGMPMPGGGPRMPGGGCISPGGGIPGGGPPRPPDICGPDEIWPRPMGAIMSLDGPPTPGAGPDKPAGALLRDAVGTPRPAARPMPGPGPPTAAPRLSCCGGGPATLNATTFSPRRMMRPSGLFSSRSAPPFFALIVRNSSASPRTRFMCLSYAINVPMIVRRSDSVIFIR